MTRLRIDTLTIVFLAILYPSSLCCQSAGAPSVRTSFPEYVEEFFLSDAVRNQNRGELQVTLGVDSQRNIGTSGNLKLEYGLTRRLQFNFEQSYGNADEQVQRASSQWGPASAGMQYQICSSSTSALSVGFAVGMPSNGESEIEFQPTILAARAFRRVQIHASFGTGLGRERPSFQYNLASVFPVHPGWYPTLEFNGRSLAGRNAFYLTPGIYRRLGRQFELGIGTPFGLSETAGTAGIVAKMTFEVGR